MSDAAALLFAKAVEIFAEVQGMVAENMERKSQGLALAYYEGSFFEAADKLQKERLRLFPLSGGEVLR
jgi:hypothetical protein